MRHATIIGVLIAASLFVYYPVSSYDFVSFDDPVYVSQNYTVLQGLTSEGIFGALTDRSIAMWAPVTLLSYQLDIELFGPDPGALHRTNLLFHMLNAVLLYLLLVMLTSEVWPSALVAMLFAIHPLHVESVAWISERKDVVSTFFWFTTTIAYTRYVHTKRRDFYLLTIFLFILGLLSKPMLVTLPCTLLLLDFWPLRRLGTLSEVKACLLEKVPLFVITAAFILITYMTQSTGGATVSMQPFVLPWLLENALISYAMYLWQTAVPTGLSVYYPHEFGGHPLLQWAAALSLIVILTMIAIASWKKRPYIATGWFWFLGTLVPVIGIVQVGSQARADRYTYIPLIGIFIILSWLLWHFIQKRTRVAQIVTLTGVAIGLLLLAVQAHNQVQHWENTETLFTHALDVQENNFMAHTHLAMAVMDNDPTRGIWHFEKAVESATNKPWALSHLAVAHKKTGNSDQAIRFYEEAIGINPNHTPALIGLGRIHLDAGNLQNATVLMRRALDIGISDPMAYFDLGRIETLNGNNDLATQHFRACLNVLPTFTEARIHLGNNLATLGLLGAAKQEYEVVLMLDPENQDALAGLTKILSTQRIGANAGPDI